MTQVVLVTAKKILLFWPQVTLGKTGMNIFFIEFIQVVPRYNVCKSKPTICTEMHGLVVATGQLIRHHWYLEPMVLNFFAYCNNALLK